MGVFPPQSPESEAASFPALPAYVLRFGAGVLLSLHTGERDPRTLQPTASNRAADGCFNPKFWWPSPRRCELRGGPASLPGWDAYVGSPLFYTSSDGSVRSASAASNSACSAGWRAVGRGIPGLPPAASTVAEVRNGAMSLLLSSFVPLRSCAVPEWLPS